MWWQECGKSGGVWEGWRLGGEVEECGWGGGVWEGWKSVGRVEVCGKRCRCVGKGGGVWMEVWRCGGRGKAWYVPSPSTFVSTPQTPVLNSSDQL